MRRAIQRTLFFVALVSIGVPAASGAKPMVADLSSHKIAITSEFKGTDLLCFGALGEEAGNIVIAVRGPEKEMVVRRKDRRLGVWVNSESETFRNLPQYYFLATMQSQQALSQLPQLAALGIGIDSLAGDMGEKRRIFYNQLLRLQQENGLYSIGKQSISFMGDTLFKTPIRFPENIPRGNYVAEIYLLKDGQVAAMQSTPLVVEKEGTDAAIYDFAHRHAGWYGLAAIGLALATGWGAGMIFRRA